MTEFIYNTENLVSTQKEQSFLSYELVDPKDPILTTKTQDFDFNSKININELASRLVETANTFNTFGLSANQCGLPYRVCVVVDKLYVNTYCCHALRVTLGPVMIL